MASCPYCEDVQIIYVGEHTEWIVGQGWVRSSWTLCRCRAKELWEAAV